jgi:FkbM family methyltransferase
VRTELFIAAGRLAARLPRVRGKTRLLLLLYRALGLETRHIRVEARLRRPVPFDAELDLHAWLQRIAFLTGGYEHETVEYLVGLHRRDGRGGYLLDVGANIGLIAIPFAKVTGKPVFAVEAVPDNVAVLRRNVERNGLHDAITIMPFALGDQPGVAQIQVEGDLRPGEGTGTGNILPPESTWGVRQPVEVQRLDDAGLPPGCSVIKIDTDGYDLKVLQGGTRFLERERPLIFGEFSAHCMGWHGQTIDDIVAFAERLHYRTLCRVEPGWAFRPYERGMTFVQDLLLLPEEQEVST